MGEIISFVDRTKKRRGAKKQTKSQIYSCSSEDVIIKIAHDKLDNSITFLLTKLVAEDSTADPGDSLEIKFDTMAMVTLLSTVTAAIKDHLSK
jgi:hypothetical protein